MASRAWFRGASVLASVACLATGLSGAAASGFRVSPDFAVEIDGRREPAATFLLSDARGKSLVEIPSWSKTFLLDLPAKKVVAVGSSDIRRTDDGVVQVEDRDAWSQPFHVLEILGPSLAFRTEFGDVRIVKAPRGSPDNAGVCASAGGAAVVSVASAAARECVALDSRPAAGVPGCTRSVFIRNICDEPVVATLKRVERLASGNLPQTFTMVVPPGEQWLCCAWWSGAMAPSSQEILSAAFLEPRRYFSAGQPQPRSTP